jgi:peptide deformylase
MVKKVFTYGSSILRQNSSEVFNSEDITELKENLFDTLSKEGGIGLAAPQIGILTRAFVVDTSALNVDKPKPEPIKKFILDPKILSLSHETCVYSEGCLSIPGIYEEVERPEKIKVTYLNELLNQVEIEINGIEARIFQHEFDHLEGILFVDRISKVRRSMIMSKLKRISKFSKR